MTIRDRFRAALKVSGRFALLGPPVGATAVGLLFIAEGILTSRQIKLSEFAVLPMFAIFSYVYGLIPALITGLIAGLLPVQRNWKWIFLIALLSASISFIYHFVVFSKELREAINVGALPGLLAGIILANIFFRHNSLLDSATARRSA